MIFPSWLRHCAAMIVMAGLLGMGVGCKHAGSSNGSVTVSGTVSFTRLPVDYAAGTLGTTGTPTVARGVVVRVFQLTFDLDQAGQPHQNWRLAGSAATDINGVYSVGGNVFPGYPTFVEVESIFQQSGGHGSVVQIIADPAGMINSKLAEPKRPIYAFRVGMDGAPLADNVIDSDNSQPPAHPIPQITGNATVNVSVGINDNWVVTLPNWYVPGSAANPSLTQQQAPPIGSPLAMGGAPLAILDNAYIFSYYYGDPTPSQVAGGALDLHYYPGRTEPTRSFVVYDTRQTPLSFDGTKSHYFGSLAAGPTFDDAWDQRVIYPILARNFLYGQAKTALFPTGNSRLPSLSPDLALVDGLADAMAAILVGSPLLTDTAAATAYATRDISVIPALSPTTAAIPSPAIASPANLAALAWNLALRGSAIPAPGTPAQWATIDPFVMARFFTLINPSVTILGPNGTTDIRVDIASILGQVGRLMEGKQPGEPVDLAKDRFQGNQVLFDLLLPFGIVWPADATLAGATDWPPHLATNWNPNLISPGPASVAAPASSITFSMTNAQQIPDPLTGALAFPNSSQGEVAYAKMAIFYDVNYKLSIDPATPIPAGAQIEVVVDGHISSQAYVFPADSPFVVTLTGNPRDSTNPTWHYIRIRLLSAAAIPDFAATLNLALVPTP